MHAGPSLVHAYEATCLQRPARMRWYANNNRHAWSSTGSTSAQRSAQTPSWSAPVKGPMESRNLEMLLE
jgi:hypothetical protein